MNTSQDNTFKNDSRNAIGNANLQSALNKAKSGFIDKRKKAISLFDGDFEALRDNAQAIRLEAINHLDVYLELFEANVIRNGGHVHWAQNAQEACDIVLSLCKEAGAQYIAKGKSMISEEIHLNAALEAAGYEVTETDLGEYIIQIRHETPSHIIAPAVHLNASEIEADFRRVHDFLPTDRDLSTKEALLQEARGVLRHKFLQADVGITGANFLIAENGSSVIVTNEGNGDLCQSLAKTHIVLASIEKIVPHMEDVSVLLRALTRSATGQSASVYTTFSHGAKKANDPDGPENYHIVLLDNGRSNMLGSNMKDILSCIRCGACINHCPIYHSIGGHAYGAVYPGPMGSVLSPNLFGLKENSDLPFASTFCGKCESVCPVKIPLPKLLRHLRENIFESALNPAPERFGLKIWGFLCAHPKLYVFISGLISVVLRLFARQKGRFSWLPLAGGWTSSRDLAAPEASTFQQQWEGGKHDKLS